MRAKSLLITVVTSFFAVFSTSGAGAASVSISPGLGPAGYLPLELFGNAPIAGIGDESITNFSVPAYSFGSQIYTELGVASNGYVIVGGGADSQAVNLALPNPLAPRNILAPFWTDLNPALGGEIRIGTLTDGIDTWIVVDWNEVADLSNVLNSFEIWIGISGDANPQEDISFAYGAVGTGSGGRLTVGAQDATGTVGATYHFNGTGGTITQGTELRVTAEGLTRPVANVPEPSAMALACLALASLVMTRCLALRRQMAAKHGSPLPSTAMTY